MFSHRNVSEVHSIGSKPKPSSDFELKNQQLAKLRKHSGFTVYPVDDNIVSLQEPDTPLTSGKVPEYHILKPGNFTTN